MNYYEERIAAKKECFADKSVKLKEEADGLHATNWGILQAMNGQPILIGHHSEKRHRKELEKVENRCRKAGDNYDKSKYYEHRAEVVGSNGIASDDPEALKKLKSKLEWMIKSQETMKLANKEFKAGGWGAIKCINEGLVQELKANKESWQGPMPFVSYQLTNNNANIRRVKQRIEEMKHLATITTDEAIEGNGFEMSTDEGRYCFSFPGIPSEGIRRYLKSKAFKWSRYRTAWVRKITGNAQRAKDDVITFLNNEVNNEV